MQVMNALIQDGVHQPSSHDPHPITHTVLQRSQVGIAESTRIKAPQQFQQHLSCSVRVILWPPQRVAPFSFERVLAGPPVAGFPDTARLGGLSPSSGPKPGRRVPNRSRSSRGTVPTYPGDDTATRADWASLMVRNNATGYSSVPCCSNPSLTSAPTESPRVYRSQGVAGELYSLTTPVPFRASTNSLKKAGSSSPTAAPPGKGGPSSVQAAGRSSGHFPQSGAPEHRCSPLSRLGRSCGRPGTGELNASSRTPPYQRLVDEGTVVVRVDAHCGQGQLPANGFQTLDHQELFPG